jgi:tryptophanyl-tRNA synthetase
MKSAFSGRQVHKEEHARLGGRTEIDVAYQYLSYFLDDDEELQRIHDEYESGRMLTGELKKIAIQEIWNYVSKFQARRASITKSELRMFMDGSRPLRLNPRYNWENKASRSPFQGLIAGKLCNQGEPVSLLFSGFDS